MVIAAVRTGMLPAWFGWLSLYPEPPRDIIRGDSGNCERVFRRR